MDPKKCQKLPTKTKHSDSFALKNLAVSTVVSLSTKTIMAPAERIKLMYQAQGELIKSGRLKKPWTSYYDLIKRTTAKEGVSSYWKGNGTYLLRYTINSGLGLMAKDELLRIDPIGEYINNSKNQPSALKNVIYGGLGGLTGMTVAYPLEYARTRLANDITSKGKAQQFNGMFDAMTQAWRSHGIKGLYRGFSITIPTITLYRGLEYGIYDTFCKEKTGFYASLTGKFLTAYVISNTLTTLLYPLNTIRVRLVMTTGEHQKYKSFSHAVKTIYINEGAKVFFRGMGANFFKNIGTSVVLVGYDVCSEIVRRHSSEQIM